MSPGPTHYIDLNTAVSMTTTYRTQKENLLVTQYRGQDILATCETFSVSAIQALLDEPDCAKIRVYFGMDSNYKVHCIIVGVNENDEDLLPTQSEGTGGEIKIVEEGLRCPPLCPPTSPLNS